MSKQCVAHIHTSSEMEVVSTLDSDEHALLGIDVDELSGPSPDSEVAQAISSRSHPSMQKPSFVSGLTVTTSKAAKSKRRHDDEGSPPGPLPTNPRIHTLMPFVPHEPIPSSDSSDTSGRGAILLSTPGSGGKTPMPLHPAAKATPISSYSLVVSPSFVKEHKGSHTGGKFTREGKRVMVASAKKTGASTSSTVASDQARPKRGAAPDDDCYSEHLAYVKPVGHSPSMLGRFRSLCAILTCGLICRRVAISD